VEGVSGSFGHDDVLRLFRHVEPHVTNRVGRAVRLFEAGLTGRKFVGITSGVNGKYAMSPESSVIPSLL
jgi:hypothetical protein